MKLIQPVQPPFQYPPWYQPTNYDLNYDPYNFQYQQAPVVPTWYGDYVWDPGTGGWYKASEYNNMLLGLNPDGSNPKTTNQVIKSGDKYTIDVTDEADPSKTNSYDITYTPPSSGGDPDGYDQNGNPFW